VTLVGIVPTTLRGGTVLSSYPLVIPVGDGTRTYTRCSETRAVWETLKEMEATLTESGSGIQVMESKLRAEVESLELQRSNLDALLARGNTRAYNNQVPAYNAAIRSYNQLLDEYREKSERYNSLADLHNYILQHQHDRKGTFDLLFG
jgi:ABC-type transporter Mla subunit MlaD